MAKKSQRSVVEIYSSIRRRDAHPHLRPIYTSTFTADRALVLDKGRSLLRYREYLAAARAAKAERRGATMSFERTVLGQARQARADLEAFSSAALRATQQVNATSLWRQVFADFGGVVNETGPVTLRQMWNDIVRDDDHREMLAGHGLSTEVEALMSEVLEQADATMSLQDGRLSVESRLPNEDAPRHVAIGAGPRPPRTIVDLLRRSQFDRVVSAVLDKRPVYLELVSAPGVTEYAAADLIAFGVVSARQRMSEHVRKLEDTGLATYQGEDPLTFITTVVMLGILLGMVGWGILETCELSGTDDWICTAGAVLLCISLGMLAFGVLAIFIEGAVIGFAAWIAIPFVLEQLIENMDRLAPGFEGTGSS